MFQFRSRTNCTSLTSTELAFRCFANAHEAITVCSMKSSAMCSNRSSTSSSNCSLGSTSRTSSWKVKVMASIQNYLPEQTCARSEVFVISYLGFWPAFIWRVLWIRKIQHTKWLMKRSWSKVLKLNIVIWRENLCASENVNLILQRLQVLYRFVAEV